MPLDFSVQGRGCPFCTGSGMSFLYGDAFLYGVGDVLSVRGRDAIRFFCTGSAMSFLYGVGDAIRFFCTGSGMPLNLSVRVWRCRYV